ncbi:Dyp-type peroxidase [Thalassotalea sp. 1_MG-2023]|uniref:Dyp-type peroxidase n=1 Tax=Thalassotalea sp. 1_MG-2023 TaxID=3062680 RepID=UPI0026E339E1|nr:Dyp-type peroxidase domain-containing protein [Thalassotalea sp. 1_MG-2023]MDO6427677.1 Dyp-type peroxidase [Thalassotalea sp. 1_MG-2023]
MDNRIQEGTNWDIGAKPKSHLKLLILETTENTSSKDLRLGLKSIWQVLQSLKSGVVPSLGSDYPVDPKELEVLIGYGHKFFEREDLIVPTPEGMLLTNRFPQPNNIESKQVIPGSGIIYDEDIQENVADAELVIQLTANSQLSVNRGHVEILKLLNAMDEENPLETGRIKIKEAFDGFGREDHRSWIDFHDGISNLRKGEERKQVVAIKPDNSGGQDWTHNGTYMVFMRLPVNLKVWSEVPYNEQEILVGRTKKSGCPIIRIAPDGTPVPDPRCPVSGTREITEEGNEQFREPSAVVSDEIKLSHVQRANHHRSPVFKPDSRRIYRQGFEFVESVGNTGDYRVGLNFISFQDDPDRVLFILTQPDWLGNLSFGGDPNNQYNGIDKLVTARAAATYFVPPDNTEVLFPGENMFPR